MSLLWSYTWLYSIVLHILSGGDRSLSQACRNACLCPTSMPCTGGVGRFITLVFFLLGAIVLCGLSCVMEAVVSYILCVFPSFRGGRLELVPVTPSWLQGRSHGSIVSSTVSLGCCVDKIILIGFIITGNVLLIWDWVLRESFFFFPPPASNSMCMVVVLF